MQDAKTKNVEHVLILSGDHLYRMDYMNFVQVSFILLFFRTELHVNIISFLVWLRRSTLSQMPISQFLVFPWMRGVSEDHNSVFCLFFWMNLFGFFLYTAVLQILGCLKLTSLGKSFNFRKNQKEMT